MAIRVDIPVPAIARLGSVYRLLCELSLRGERFVQSGEIAERLGAEAHSIRKDIGYVSDVASGRSGYDVERLKRRIAKRFGFDRELRGCVVGMGRLGMALLSDGQYLFDELKIIAGFDPDVNLVETISVDIPVYPSYDITDTVRRLNIDTAILTVPAPIARECANRLVKGGIRGIINFTPEHINVGDGVTVKNIDIAGGFRELSALMFLNA